MYPKIDEQEKSQVEEVFGLTGGELSDKPMRIAELKYDPGIPSMIEKWGKSYAPKWIAKRWWVRYFYDGVPSYVERDFRNMSGSFFTMVKNCLFGSPALHIVAQGKIWRRVATYTSSGETDCPFQGVSDEDVPWAERTHLGDRSTVHHCPACEAEKGEEHGCIYLGEGWAEIVYRARD